MWMEDIKKEMLLLKSSSNEKLLRSILELL